MAFAKANLVTTAEWRLLIQSNDEGNKEKLIWIYKKVPHWYYAKLRDPNDRTQTKLTTELCRLVGLPTNRLLAVSEIHIFKEFLNVDILVTRSVGGNKFIKTPPENNVKQRLYLYLSDVHDEKSGIKNLNFDAIVNCCGFFGQSKFCSHCLKPYQNLHQCEVTCYVCKSKKECRSSDVKVSCKLCQMTCRSLSCYKNH